jgi:hypothetical protein
MTVRGYKPQIADFLILLLGGLEHRDYDPLAIGAHDGLSDTLHHPQQFVGNGGSRSGRDRARKHQASHQCGGRKADMQFHHLSMLFLLT